MQVCSISASDKNYEESSVVNRSLKILLNVTECIASTVIYIFITAFLYALKPTEEAASDTYRFNISPYLSFLIMFFALCSLVRFSFLFDKEMKEKFASDGDGLYTYREHFRFLLGFEKTWIGLVFSAVLYLCLPLEILSIPLFYGTEPSIVIKLALFPLYMCIVFAVLFWSSRSAAQFWYDDSRRIKTKKFYTASNRIRKTVMLIISYSVGGALFVYLGHRVSLAVMTNSYLISRKAIWAVLLFIVFIVVIPALYRQTGSILKRKKFIKNLKKVCAEHRCSLSEIKRPYRSLFKLTHGYDFDFELNGTKYACKLLYTKHRLRPITFFDNGMAAHENVIKVKKTELFRVRSWFEYDFSANAKKLLIINPIPKTVSASENGRISLIDNGDRVGEYKIYSATALVNAIDRNCLDR